MKLHYYLASGDKTISLPTMRATLSRMTAGRAILTTPTALNHGDSLTVMMGYNAQIRPWMTGFVEHCQKITATEYRSVLREPGATLAAILPLSLVHTTLSRTLAAISEQTGLVLHTPKENLSKQSANLTHKGTGYQLLAQLGDIFHLPDYTWFHQPDGSIWLGSWSQSHWSDKPTEIDLSLMGQLPTPSGMSLPMLPGVRPDCRINGSRVGQVLFNGTSMELTWAEKEPLDRRHIKQLFPELGALAHLPQLGRVVAVSEAVTGGHLSDAWRPGLAVDVQMVTPDGADNMTVPVFHNVPLPGTAGHGVGLLARPEVGTLVEIAFAWGRPDKPFIRTILSQGLTLPALPLGEWRQQHHDASLSMDAGSDISLDTTQQLHQKSARHALMSDDYHLDGGRYGRQIATHDEESVLGHRNITANWLTLLGLSGTRIGTEKTHEVLAGENLLETIGKLRKSVAETHWAGSEGTNIYQLLLQLMAAVEALAKAAATHTHISAMPGQPNQAPLNADAFSAQGQQAKTLQDTLSPLI